MSRIALKCRWFFTRTYDSIQGSRLLSRLQQSSFYRFVLPISDGPVTLDSLVVRSSVSNPLMLKYNCDDLSLLAKVILFGSRVLVSVVAEGLSNSPIMQYSLIFSSSCPAVERDALPLSLGLEEKNPEFSVFELMSDVTLIDCVVCRCCGASYVKSCDISNIGEVGSVTARMFRWRPETVNNGLLEI